MRKFVVAGLVAGISLMLIPSASGEVRPYVSFLEDLVDLKSLATLPVRGETCKQFSSYDRVSLYDSESDKYVNWDANNDRGNFLRKEPEGDVLADMDGPGCIYRIWSANPQGTLKIYLDKAKDPVINIRFADFFSGSMKPVAEPLVGYRAKGANSYLPIPYQKHCKVIVEGSDDMYYHVTYRIYPPETQVQTFHWPLSEVEQQKLHNVMETMRNRGPAQLQISTDVKVERISEKLKAGKSLTLAEIRGRKAIIGINLSLEKDELSPAEKELCLRMLTLTGYWDDEEEPSIWVPLGDFFGTSPGFNNYRSLPPGVTDKGELYCRWYMPFQTSGKLVLRNDWDKDIQITSEILYEPHDISSEDIAYFHARWRRQYPNTVFEWPFLECNGQGRYVGVMLTIWNPDRGWWGEGDEKIYVDGEKFPSTFGTGTEDYFGYAWSSTDIFSHAFHNQTLCEGPFNQNYTSVNRWQIADNIPFQKSIRVTIENYGHNLDYACTAYWYAGRFQKDFFEILPLPERVLQERIKLYEVEGAIECEWLKVLGKGGDGRLTPQEMGMGSKWSDETHLWFNPVRIGEWVEMELPAKKTGRYQMIIYLTRGPDYGIEQISVNGQKADKPYDAYNETLIPSGPVPLGVFDLQAGKNTLRFEVADKNTLSRGFAFGFDCITLEPAD